ncbi:hypothetical protein KY363_06805, partial [Candidatus Woesearchaeota archaeon]|nr:hypothetical protein [Candidatus Woesearchaeota archaeon]
TDMTNVVRVNFQEYSMSRLGNLEVELTGSQDRKVIVQYVGKVSEKADMVNKLVRFKKSQTYSVGQVQGGQV